MSNLTFDQLMKLPKDELNKMNKADIIESIHTYSFYYKHNIDDVKEAREKLVEQSKGEVFAKKMLAGYLGKAQEKDEHDGDYINRLNLPELVGETLCKASRYE